MRVMVMVKATPNSEKGLPPKEKFEKALEAMGKFNDELAKAGVLLAMGGLQPSSKGKRVRFAGTKRTVMDGPFAEAKELVAGFWLWQVKSMEEAVEWVRRCPEPMPGEESDIEIRPLFEVEDLYGGELDPEQRARMERLESAMERHQK